MKPIKHITKILISSPRVVGKLMVGILKRRTEHPSEDCDDETDASIAE